MASSKSNGDVTKTSDATAIQNQSESINFNLNNNFGTIVICDNGKFNFDVRPDYTNIQQCETNVKDIPSIHSQQNRFTSPSKQVKEDQLLAKKNVKGVVNNRSEFCRQRVFVPKTENVYKAIFAQPCTSTAECPHKTYICDERNTNINIAMNDGSVMICENGEFTINVLPTDRSIQGFETSIKDKQSIFLVQKRLMFPLASQQVEESQTLSKNSSRNPLLSRSEFCLVSKAGNVNKAVQCRQCNVVGSMAAKDIAQPCTSKRETALESCEGDDHNSLQIQNNFGINIFCTTLDKFESSEGSNVYTATGNQLRKNISVNINDNYGIIMICKNVEFKFVRHEHKNEELKANTRCEEDVQPKQKCLISSLKQFEDDRLISNEDIKNVSTQQVGILSL